ncbi:MAG: Gfo/Idh/MocA family oxidoreductase [Planctomycetaceae bacterium]|jgi:predicted dehydrogenase|nr:Gfo/Idh/MocA family oxidoreductase [Planctomycetaceae bacterium]
MNHSQRSPYNVLIIGGGQIGALYDTPDSPSFRSHAHCFTEHPRFAKPGIVEPNAEQRRKVADRWNCTTFETLDAALTQTVDAAVVAVPDFLHYSVLKELAQHQLKLVIAEKPMTKTVKESEEILSLYRSRNIPLCVNYTRRFAPGFAALKERIQLGEFGQLLQGTGWYGKGVVHNGSHLVDLLLFLFGNASAESVFHRVNDFYEDDPAVSALLRIGSNNAPFVLQGIDCRCFTIFEIELFFQKGRLRMTNHGETVEEYGIEPGKEFAGYQFLHKKTETPTGLNKAMYNVAEAAAQFLDNGVPLPSTGETAFAAQKLCCHLQSRL